MMPVTRDRTREEAAAELEMSAATLSRYIKRGDLDKPPMRPWGKSQRPAYTDQWLADAKLKMAISRRQSV